MENLTMISKTLGMTFIFLFIFTTHLYYYFIDFINSEEFEVINPVNNELYEDFNPCDNYKSCIRNFAIYGIKVGEGIGNAIHDLNYDTNFWGYTHKTLFDLISLLII